MIHRWGRERCQAFGHTCTICGKENHFEAVCFYKQKRVRKTKSLPVCHDQRKLNEGATDSKNVRLSEAANVTDGDVGIGSEEIDSKQAGESVSGISEVKTAGKRRQRKKKKMINETPMEKEAESKPEGCYIKLDNIMDIYSSKETERLLHTFDGSREVMRELGVAWYSLTREEKDELMQNKEKMECDTWSKHIIKLREKQLEKHPDEIWIEKEDREEKKRVVILCKEERGL